MLKKKAQAALEFILTYGWIFLMVLVFGVSIWQLGLLDLSGNTPFSAHGFTNLKPLLASGTFNSTNADVTILFTNTMGTTAYISTASIYNLRAGGFFDPNSTYCSSWIKIVGDENWTQLSNKTSDCEEGWGNMHPDQGFSHYGFSLAVLSHCMSNEHKVPRWELAAPEVAAQSEPTCRCTSDPSCAGNEEQCGFCISDQIMCCDPCCTPPCEEDCHSKYIYNGLVLPVKAGKVFALYASDTCGHFVTQVQHDNFVELGIHIVYLVNPGLASDQTIIKTTSGILRGPLDQLG